MLIKNSLYLGSQTFRINRGIPQGRDKKGNIIYGLRPGWWKRVVCEKAGDQCYDKGFTVKLEFPPTLAKDELALNRERYRYIREKSGRHFTETWQDALCVFEFPAGQRCFGHSVPVERDPVFANVNRRDGVKVMDYDRFFTTFNEVTERQKQHRRQF